VPLETYVSKFTNMRFEPAGMTDDPDILMATSIVDYVFRRLALDFLPYERRADFDVFTAMERAARARAKAAGEDVDLAAMAPSAPIEAPAEPAAVAKAQAASPERAPKREVVHGSTELLELMQGRAVDAPLCFTCGTKMHPAGSCYVCEGCGSTSGCS
jgi:ribonucleoside-diphosphate reductase alpha chain